MAEPQMVPIIHLRTLEGRADVTPQLNYEAFENIIMDKRFEGIPFFVLSLTGKRRNGKSFLANLLLSKLRYQEKNLDSKPSWIDSDDTVEGVEWKQQRDSVTHGIWVFRRPIIVMTPNKTKVAVILMDCEGLYDQGQQTKDAVISLYSLELAKTQVFNSDGDITSSDMEHLQACIYAAEYSGLSQMFNTLIFLHRDWERDEQYGNRGSYFAKKKNQLTETEKAVESAFEETTEYTLPTPGRNIRKGDVSIKASLKDFKKDAESADFLNEVDRFVDFLLKEHASQARHLCSQQELFITLERLKEHIQPGNRSFTYPSPAEVFERRQILNIYEEMEDHYLPGLGEKVKMQDYKYHEKAKMLSDLENVENAAMEYVRRLQVTRPPHTAIGKEAWSDVDEKVRQWFSALRIVQLEKLGDKPELSVMKKLLLSVSVAGLAALTGVGIGTVAIAVLKVTANGAVTSILAGTGAATGLTGGIASYFKADNIAELIKMGRKNKMQAKQKKEN